MNTMFKSATFKLTMWYLAIVMVISLIFSVVVYHFATGELSTGLQNQTQRIFNEFPVFNGSPQLVQRPDRDLAVGTHHILWELINFNILVLISAEFASYFLARRTLEPIELAHERQKRFTADVSHELRTPLTSLKMGSEVALMDSQADKKTLRAALESNMEDAGTMEQLINNLLRLTRLDNDSSLVAFSPVESGTVISGAVNQLDKAAGAKAIAVTAEGPSLTINGDQDALMQLIVILLDNAIKYSSPGASVAITTSRQGNQAQIAVRDEGQGIAPAALPHVFDRFYREDVARQHSATEGFGIGLSIAKLIADRHQGTITLTSRVGKGTTATVLLPLHSEAAKPTPSRPTKPATTPE